MKSFNIDLIKAKMHVDASLNKVKGFIPKKNKSAATSLKSGKMGVFKIIR